MIYYTSHPGATNPQNDRVRFILENDIRLMISVENWKSPFTRYAVDNGAWTAYTRGEMFNPETFKKGLLKVEKQSLKPDFIVLPDILKGGKKSLNLSVSWLHLSERYPVYLAVQDGIIPDMVVPYLDKLSGIFVGGSDEWKWRNLHTWHKFAKEHGLNIHVGKVGTAESFRKCILCGVDSADGSSLIRNGKYRNIVQYMAQAEATKRLSDYWGGN